MATEQPLYALWEKVSVQVRGVGVLTHPSRLDGVFTRPVALRLAEAHRKSGRHVYARRLAKGA